MVRFAAYDGGRKHGGAGTESEKIEREEKT